MKRHRKAIRLRDYNYSHAGGYFITICTFKRTSYFETFSELKPIIYDYWHKIEQRFAEIKTDEFVIMPNHIHGMLFIVENPIGKRATQELPLQKRRNMILPRAICYYKMNTAKLINQILNRTGQPLWQRNYYEHIIHSEDELFRIREYIKNNPLRWTLDRENPLSENFDLDHDLYWKNIYGVL